VSTPLAPIYMYISTLHHARNTTWLFVLACTIKYREYVTNTSTYPAIKFSYAVMPQQCRTVRRGGKQEPTCQSVTAWINLQYLFSAPKKLVKQCSYTTVITTHLPTDNVEFGHPEELKSNATTSIRYLARRHMHSYLLRYTA
jgi:hypothetical protein